MTTICKFIRASLYPLHHKVLIRHFASTTCGGSKGDNGDKGSENGSESHEYPCCSCPSDYNPSTPSMYDCRKYGHCLPSNNVMPCFEPLANVPTGIFRCTAGETLGRGADKCSCYPCPEYFSYQHMTYYDMHLILRGCRLASPKTGRKP